MSEKRLPRNAAEEDVKVKFLAPYLRDHGYSEDCIDYDVAITVQEGTKRKTIFADAVVYTSPHHTAPVLLCEAKRVKVPLSRPVREQAISYARLLDSIAPLALITNGLQTQVFHTLSKRRLPELPQRSALDEDVLKFVLSPQKSDALRLEAKHELFVIDDVKTFKQILLNCHFEIRNNEDLDPVAAFDEMSKVLFCKLYEEKENAGEDRFQLAMYERLEELGVNSVRTILEEAKGKPGYNDVLLEHDQIQLKDRTIKGLVKLLESYDLSLTKFDVGEAFEFFLGETFTGGLGEYFTPRNVVEFMVEATDPKIGDKIIDPFCGTGGFLIYAFEIVSEKIRLNEKFSEREKSTWRERLSGESLFGTDWKKRTATASKMNMMIHGDGSSGIFMQDGLRDVPGRIESSMFDLCLTNPPFGSVERDDAVLNAFHLGRGHQSRDRVVLAVERCIQLTRPGGQIVMVVIDGILNNPTATDVRKFIRKHTHIEAVVSLNAETFQGYGAGAKTSILFLKRRNGSDEQGPVFMAVARKTRYAPNGDPIPGNELPDILLDLDAFRRGEEPQNQDTLSWITHIKDRLDAEYYQLRTAVSIVSPRALWKDIAKKTESVSDQLKARGIEEICKDLPTTTVKVGEVLQEVKETTIDSGLKYRICGVRGKGKGVFFRQEKYASEITPGNLRTLRTGWIVYNRLFARKGSFAIVPDKFDGCCVSNEFPTFDTRPGIDASEMLKRFIVHLMNSPQFQEHLGALSTGSTQQSRKRLNPPDFLKLEVGLPKSSTLREIVNALDGVSVIRREQEQLAKMSQELMDAVLRLLPGSSAGEIHHV